MQANLLVLAGIGNSGPEHWQSQWQAELPSVYKLDHSNWDAPDRVVWEAELEEKLATMQRPVILVAHSLACLLVAHWAERSPCKSVTGALLVSVPNPDGTAFPEAAKNFSQVPMNPLPFPSLVVSSTNDPYGSTSFMQACASAWKSGFQSVGPCGHINASSNLGSWEYGKSLLHLIEA
jgi:uncharacterized protein